MTTRDPAQDDVVRTFAEAARNARLPLLVLEGLLPFLDAHGLGSGDPRVTAIGDGHSNVTFLIERGGTAFVLRRPPRPPWPPSAHDVLREARVQQSLRDTAVRVPEILAVCADPDVIGAPFYVMEYIDADVLKDGLQAEIDTPEARRAVSFDIVDALAELHAVDWREAGLADFGASTGYLQRQLRRFSGLWAHNKTREIPEVDAIERWLRANVPPDRGAARLVHGDYRLGNVLVGTSLPARVEAVLDWEMSTIGDPLADVGYLCTHWADPGDPPVTLCDGTGLTDQPGFLTRAELVSHYESRSGLPVADLRWYESLSLWKSAIFMEGNYKRAQAGSTDDPFLHAADEAVASFVERAATRTRAAA